MREKVSERLIELLDKDHPRVCGEKTYTDAMLNNSLDHPRVCGEKLRVLQRAISESRDHPRVCGEKAPMIPLFSELQGSPPRMRGKVRFPIF